MQPTTTINIAFFTVLRSSRMVALNARDTDVSGTIHNHDIWNKNIHSHRLQQHYMQLGNQPVVVDLLLTLIVLL
jgi:hypothetical protein